MRRFRQWLREASNIHHPGSGSTSTFVAPTGSFQAGTGSFHPASGPPTEDSQSIFQDLPQQPYNGLRYQVNDPPLQEFIALLFQIDSDLEGRLHAPNDRMAMQNALGTADYISPEMASRFPTSHVPGSGPQPEATPDSIQELAMALTRLYPQQRNIFAGMAQSWVPIRQMAQQIVNESQDGTTPQTYHPIEYKVAAMQITSTNQTLQQMQQVLTSNANHPRLNAFIQPFASFMQHWNQVFAMVPQIQEDEANARQTFRFHDGKGINDG